MYQEEKPTVVSLSQGDISMSATLPWDANIQDTINAFVGCLRGLTFSEETIKRGFQEWCEEQEDE